MPRDDSVLHVTPTIVRPLIISEVAEQGEMDQDEIVRAMIEAVIELNADPEIDHTRAITRAITGLDRQGILTKSPGGFQVTAKGHNALKDLQSRQVASYIAPYARFAVVKAALELISPSLGPLTGPGGEGLKSGLDEPVNGNGARGKKKGAQVAAKARFPRRGEDGPILFYGGWIRKALMKAADRTEAIVHVDLQGQPRKLPGVAWDHVTIKPVVLPADTPLVESIRRPTNVRNQAVGELVHEALAPGTVLNVEAIFPLSHFPEPLIRRIFTLVCDVGISPAGSGKGGIWGLCELIDLKIDEDALSRETGFVTPPQPVVRPVYETVAETLQEESDARPILQV